MARGSTEVVTSRLDRRERAVIQAAAKMEGVTVSRLVRSIVVPVATRRVQRSLSDILDQDGEETR